MVQISSEDGLAQSRQKYLVVGLGNPGRSYRQNRHNIGFMVIDRLAEKHRISLSRVQKKAIVGDGLIAGCSVILAKPQTFMNLSGDSVSSLVNYFKIPLSNLLVVYDEIDLSFGALRLREQGGSGGHKGMKSIIQHLDTGFSRLRLGVGRPPGKMDPAAYVLQNFSKAEQPILDEMIDLAISATETYLAIGIDIAMTRFNGPVTESR